MKSAAENIIYIGKAVNLRSRVRQYFQPSSQMTSLKLKNLSPNIASFEYIVTDSELEALILENNLIKKHRPKYNVLLKDDKSYAYLKLTLSEPYPRLIVARQHKKSRDKYFGPFISSQKRHDILEIVHKIWPLRRCTKKLSYDAGASKAERPCLNYHIGQCRAPCNGLISPVDYDRMIHEVLAFLNGKSSGIVKRLEAEMAQCAADMEFEKAAELRDKIGAIRYMDDEQKLDATGADNQDIIAFAKSGDTALVQIFFIRSGKMTGREQLMMTGAGDQDDSDILTGFIKQFYSETTFIPKELVVPCEPLDRDIITTWLSHLRDNPVAITVPKKGEKLGLCELAAKNAQLTLEQFGEHMERERARTTSAVDELREALDLPGGVERIEAYDISNTSGVLAVGSMIVFENGKPKTSDYRKFRIKYGDGQSDFESLREVIARRFLRYKQEREDAGENGAKFLKLPQLILMDGGAAQVAAAEEILNSLGIDIPVAGMVKDGRHRTRALLYGGREVELPAKSEGFKLLTRIQDEVHRFVVEYHRRLREREMVRSQLDEIKGIGPKRRQALMQHFKDIDKIRFAGVEELAKAPGMTEAAANAVYEFFKTE
ncbi:MAG: excinuclease ABC subunit UvrC [Defluviitaleaceae bacterium]|nr:excinuclease ABC subunit UvrC [Defluviitaleaceae bacterium]